MEKQLLLQAQNIDKRFAKDGAAALDQVSLSLYAGDFMVIMGASGAGKSTLLCALSGLETLSGGQVLYKDNPLSDFSPRQISRLWAQEFGFIFQQVNLVSHLTVRENIALSAHAGKSRGRQSVDRRVDDLLAQMKLTSAKDRLPAQVSGGEAQRTALARAIIHSPALLFADEPTGALNQSAGTQLLDILTELNRSGQTILMVTHEVRAAMRGSRILYLEDGKILDELNLPPYGQEPAEDTQTPEAPAQNIPSSSYSYFSSSRTGRQNMDRFDATQQNFYRGRNVSSFPQQTRIQRPAGNPQNPQNLPNSPEARNKAREEQLTRWLTALHW